LKILILKPSSLGDVIQALPVLRLLKRQYPHSEIYWWIFTDLQPLLEDDPDLAGLFAFNRQQWRSPRRWHELFTSIRHMRALAFDYVIDLQSLARSAYVAWLACGACTIGLDDSREGAHAFYDVAIPRRSPQTHAVDWYLSVLRWLAVPVTRDFEWLPRRTSVAAAMENKWPVNSGSWLVLLPGARWPNKRWPIEHFAQLVQGLSAAQPHLHFVILGSAVDRPLGQIIARACPQRCLDLTGQSSLPEMVEWIRASAAVVTNDTGPMHVAAALGKPVIALFGPTDPRRTGPYGQIAHALHVSLPCAPCLKAVCRYEKPLECLKAIKPETVQTAVLARLSSAIDGKEGRQAFDLRIPACLPASKP
jgi:heptosyltransferase I